jgi:class 3 adenylate cyclase
MAEHPSASPLGRLAGVNLKTYSADLQLSTLTIGVDNIHYDVFLSPRFVELAKGYLLDLIRQTAGLTQFSGMDSKPFKAPETGAFRKVLTELLQASLTRAKYEKNIELDLLLRLSVLKFLTQELGNQFSDLLLEGKEWIRSRGAHFDSSEQGHLLKARLAELQADRRNIVRQVGQHIHQMLAELEETILNKSRRTLFGDDFGETYELLKNRLVFVEGGKDDTLYLEQYVLLGNYLKDDYRFATIDAILIEFLRELALAGDPGDEMGAAQKAHQELVDTALRTRTELARLEEERDTLRRRLERGDHLFSRVLGRAEPATVRASLADVETQLKHLQQKLESLGPQLEAAKRKAEFLEEQHKSRLGDYLNQPENARRLFDPRWAGGEPGDTAQDRAQRLEGWASRLEQRSLLVHVLASYELRNVYRDYCPPVHLQQLKMALVLREELKHVEDILKQFPARRFSLERIEELAKKLRRYPREEARALALRFAEDFMRLRRDLRSYQRLTALMERINLLRSEKTRELSQLNRSLYEFLLPEESRPAEDRMVTHTIIKADVRGSTKLTQDMLARGLNPASHLSLHLYEPLKRILERFDANKVFIEGDAIVLAIYENESNRTHQRAVAKACSLARHILAVSRTYNARAESSELPPLELGVGIAFQSSPPTYWMDSGSRIMISRALNLSDRLSSCSKVARRLLAQNVSPFRVFLFQTVMEGASEEEAEEFLIRFNLNGIELNEEGYGKLTEEISLAPVEAECVMPWGRERVELRFGEVFVGETIEPIVIRKGFVRQLLPDGRIGAAGTRSYYEVCATAEVLELVEAQVGSVVRKD